MEGQVRTGMCGIAGERRTFSLPRCPAVPDWFPRSLARLTWSWPATFCLTFIGGPLTAARLTKRSTCVVTCLHAVQQQARATAGQLHVRRRKERTMKIPFPILTTPGSLFSSLKAK